MLPVQILDIKKEMHEFNAYVFNIPEQKNLNYNG